MPLSASAATNVTEDIKSDTDWTLAGSPYIINFKSNPYFPRFLTVNAGATLTIDAGVVVKFGSDNGLLVKGSLHAVGTNASPIIFTSLQDDTAAGDTNGDGNSTLPTDEQWMHLDFITGSSGHFDYSFVRYGGAHLIPLLNTGIENSGGSLLIEHTMLTHNGYDGFGQRAGHTVMTNSVISNQQVGITMTGGLLDLRDSHIFGNTDSGIDHWKGTLLLTHSQIDHNGLGIVAHYQGTIAVTNSSLHDNTTGGPPIGISNESASVVVDARNNWWGSASGPHDEVANPGGTGDSVYGAVDYSSWLTSDPFESCPATGCASNILFLPGIEASRLYRPDYNGGTDRLWEPTSDADAKDLFLTADGKSVRNDVYTKDVIDEKLGFAGNIYKSFLGDLEQWKTTDHIITDYGVAPYDWRLSLDDILSNGSQFPDGRIYYSGDLAATTSPYIIQELKRLAVTSKTGKVTIIAHSNGGLVAKALTQKLGDAEAARLIDKIIFVAVPQVGTPQTVGAILHGYDQGLPFNSFPVLLTQEIARTLAQNMPSAYNFLPSAAYFTHVDDPVITFDNSAFLAPWRATYGGIIHSAERLHLFVADQSRPPLPVSNDLSFPISGNETLMNRAEITHTALDNWTPPPGVPLIEIAGWGEDTPKTIAYYQGWKTYCSDPTASTCPSYVTVPALEYGVKEVLDGDGTVVVPSALWTTTSTRVQRYWVDLGKYNSLLGVHLGGPFAKKHADILEVPSLRTFIRNAVTGTSIPLAFISTSTPSNPDPTTRLHFALHSPLRLNLYDTLGNHTGISTTTGFLEETIPGSSYRTYGELTYVDAPASTTLRLILNGYASGSFTLDMEKQFGDTVLASTTFAGIPSSTSTIATINIPQGGDIAHATPLAVDYDGNGTTDFSLKPTIGKTSVFDITPPEAMIAFDSTSHQLTIIGTDNLSSTTVSTTATSSLVTDEAGNTLEIIFKKLKREKHELKLEIQSFRYNGMSTGALSKTALHYEWSINKDGIVKELEEKASVGDLKIEGHYDGRKNITKIERKLKKDDEKDGDEMKERLTGLRIIKLITSKGKIEVSY